MLFVRKINSGDIFDHKEGTLGIILAKIQVSCTIGFHLEGFESRMADSCATFLPFFENWGLLHPNVGKKSGNIFDHKEDTLGIILSQNSGL